MRAGRFPAALTLCIGAAGCDGAAAGDRGYSVFDSAGVRIVESVAPANESGFRIDPEPLVRIGREEAGPYQLAFVAGGILSDDGRIVIAEGSAEEVRVFDSAGAHVTTLGRPGEGPGEFRGLSDVFDFRGDSIVAFDGRLYRTTIFSTTSGGHRSIRNQVEGNYGVFGVIGTGGPFLLFDRGRGYRPDLTPGVQWVPTDVVTMEATDGDSHVIASLPNQWRNVAGDGNAPMPQPLMHSIHAVGADGFYWATTDQYEISFRDTEGRIRRVLRRPVDPQPVEPGTIEQFIERQLEWVRGFEGEGAVPRYRARYEEAEYGDRLPLFQSAFVDNEDRLWIGSSEWPLDRPPSRWSLFAPEGYWLGDVEAPPGLRILDAADDRVLGIWRDELDVPHVQVHRLTDAAGNDE